MNYKFWDTPKSRDVGLFSDISLYAEALDVTIAKQFINVTNLRNELGPRLKGLLSVESQSQRVARDLIRELLEFGWIKKAEQNSHAENVTYQIREEGQKAFHYFKENPGLFRRLLSAEMQNLYIIPGWFVQRLWYINPKGQGEIILPTPHKDWRPATRNWDQKEWTEDLAEETLRSAQLAQKIAPGSFPLDERIWLESVKNSWIRLGELKPKGKPNRKIPYRYKTVFKEKKQKLIVADYDEEQKVKKFSPRGRLALSMREAAINLLFNNSPLGFEKTDFQTNKHPIPPRSFRAWCPRLMELELIFYTDSHPDITGRLIFPTAVFRKDASDPPFEILNDVRNPEGEPLLLHQPTWQDIKELYMSTLYQTYRKNSARAGIIYVSLLNVRDEVCRQLRLSHLLFDKFLANQFHESLCKDSQWSISLETDIREDQRSGSGLVRRPVWIKGIPYSLIAIKKIT